MGKGLGVRLDDEVLLQPGMMLADLGVAVIDQHPDAPGLGRLVRELDPGDHPPIGEPLADQIDGAPGPQHEGRVGVLVAQFQPPFASVVERPENPRQVAAGVGELVDDAVAAGLGPSLDHPDPLKQPQPLGEQAVRQTWRSGADLAERGAAAMRLRAMIEVQRSVRISAALGIGNIGRWCACSQCRAADLPA